MAAPNAVQPHVLFNDIQSGVRQEELVFRLIHFWEARNPTKGNTLIGLELLFIDEQGTIIQGFIAPNRMYRYQPNLKPNSIYRLTGFYATDNKIMFRVTPHKFTVCFNNTSTVTELPETSYSIETQLFRFQTFSEFESAADKKGDLYDAIGHIRFIDDSQKTTGGKDRVTIHLQLRDGPVVNVYLWDNAASEMLRKCQATNTLPKVLLVTTVQPKTLGASISLTSMSPSRVFIDSEVPATREYLTWLSDNADKLNTFDASHVTKVETLTIAEIMAFINNKPSQVAQFICIATFSDVIRNAGWYYISCAGCNFKCARGPTSFICSRYPNENAVGILKYRVEFTVHDNDDTVTFVFLDDAGTQLAGRSATTLMDSLAKDNGTPTSRDEDPFPDCFSSYIGQTHKFLVKITDYNFRATRQTVTVSKLLEPASLLQNSPAETTAAAKGPATSQTYLLESNIAKPSTSQYQKKKKNGESGETIDADIAGTEPKRARHDT